MQTTLPPTSLEILHALARASVLASQTPVPAPGRYVLREWIHAPWGCAGGGNYTARDYAIVRAASCGGPHIAVEFHPHEARNEVSRVIRIAADGSWRDLPTLMPVNSEGRLCGAHAAVRGAVLAAQTA